MSERLSLVVFQIFVVGGGLLMGYLTAPGDWYTQLAKPTFTPPGWIFAPVWTILYIMIAFMGWRLSQFHQKNRVSVSMRLWWSQLGLNFLWSPIFFGAHLVGTALIVLSLLFLNILGLIIVTWRQDRLTALLNIPYAIWVSFAGVLNASIFILNSN